MLETYLFLTFDMAGLTHALKGVSLRPPIHQVSRQCSFDDRFRMIQSFLTVT